MLTATAPSVIKPLTCRERRAFPRRPARAAVSYRPGGRPFSPAVRARAVDVSQGGIGMVVPQPLRPGALLEIELERPGRGKRQVRNAEVCWTIAAPDGSYRVGCSWEHRLTFHEFQELI
jgi:hypothetical protein